MPSSSPGPPRWDLWDCAAMGSCLYVLNNVWQGWTAQNDNNQYSGATFHCRGCVEGSAVCTITQFTATLWGKPTHKGIGQIAQDLVCLRDRNPSHVVQIQSQSFRHFLPLCIWVLLRNLNVAIPLALGSSISAPMTSLILILVCESFKL